MCKNCITLSGLKAEDSFQSLTQVKYIYKKKKRKKTCIHLLLQDSQTCRHPTLPSPLSTRVERSVGFPQILLKWHQIFSQASKRSKPTYPPPTKKEKKTPPWATRRGRIAPQSNPNRAKAHSRHPETLSPLRVQTVPSPRMSLGLPGCLALIHARSKLQYDQRVEEQCWKFFSERGGIKKNLQNKNKSPYWFNSTCFPSVSLRAPPLSAPPLMQMQRVWVPC